MLKLNDWVWDNRRKSYGKVTHLFSDGHKIEIQDTNNRWETDISLLVPVTPPVQPGESMEHNEAWLDSLCRLISKGTEVVFNHKHFSVEEQEFWSFARFCLHEKHVELVVSYDADKGQYIVKKNLENVD